MKKVYACLLGNWVCLNDDAECTMGQNRTSPSLWAREDSELNTNFVPEVVSNFDAMPSVEICYLGKTYRINPAFIQIVTE